MHKLLTALVVAISLGVVACGGSSGISDDEADQIRNHAAEVQRDAQKTAEEVRAGTKDAEQAAEEIQDDVKDVTNETIDAVEDANIPDEAKAQLEQAQEQLNAAQGQN
jgi:hypothetical protein